MSRGGPRRPALVAAWLLVAVLALGGCASPPQLSALQSQWPSALPQAARVAGVPFHAQPGDTLCGPATLAMMVSAAGRPIAPEALTPQVYLPGRQGALQAEMLAAVRRHGLVPMVLDPSLSTVLAELAAGAPVLVLQNLSLPIAPQWHYAVAVGYDRAAGVIELHSGTTERLALSLSTFEHTWARSGHWAVRVSAPGEIPRSATPDRWVAAVAPLERLDARAAWQAYEAGRRRWPDAALLHFGAGNAAHALGERRAATAAFEAAVRADPALADAWNNLAQLRLMAGERDRARTAAQRALALGGPRRAVYEQTLRDTQAPTAR